MIRWLLDRLRRRDTDVWQREFAKHQKAGVVVKFSGYDEARAVSGFYRSKRQSPTGRPLPRPTNQKVVQIESRRAGK